MLFSFKPNRSNKNTSFRQRLFSQLLPTPKNSSLTTLPRIIQSLQIASSDSDFKKAWVQILDDWFHPVSIVYIVEDQDSAFLKKKKSLLHVPDIMGMGYYELSGKHQGNSLFNDKDVKTVKSLLSLTHAMLDASHVREKTIFAERTRIMRDLHDSLGAKLLSMVQRNQGHESADEARDALQTLRDTIHLSTTQEPLALAILLNQWRAETQERVEIIEARLHWHVEGINQNLRISSADVLILLSFLRETSNNALRHAKPENIFVSFVYRHRQISLTVSNDGLNTDPDNWKQGFGLKHLQNRLSRVGGTMKIGQRKIGQYVLVTEVQARLPLNSTDFR